MAERLKLAKQRPHSRAGVEFRRDVPKALARALAEGVDGSPRAGALDAPDLTPAAGLDVVAVRNDFLDLPLRAGGTDPKLEQILGRQAILGG